MINNHHLFDIAERDEEEEIKEGDIEGNGLLTQKSSQMHTPANALGRKNEIPGNEESSPFQRRNSRKNSEVEMRHFNS